jgi:hypothetical protein
VHDIIKQIDQDANTLSTYAKTASEATAEGTAEHLAGMADNLHTMIGMFFTAADETVPAES